jgi:hypothetical protein
MGDEVKDYRPKSKSAPYAMLVEMYFRKKMMSMADF